MQPADEGGVLGSIRSYASRLTKAGHTPADYRVLVVDDEATVRRYVVHVLKAAGYQTSAASNATEALEAFANGTFEALVTDVMMPGMTGDELARQLRQSDRGLKVLYLTGYSDRLFKEKTGLWRTAFLKAFHVKRPARGPSLLVRPLATGAATAKKRSPRRSRRSPDPSPSP